MFEVLLQKFEQHPELKEALLDTEEKELLLVSGDNYFQRTPELIYVQASRDDTWGIGDDKKGENKFGKALMALRARLLEQLQ